MNRLIEKTVFWGLVTACLFAICPTSRSPSLVKPTTEGVVRPPSAFGMTTGSPPSITATTELVVPRSVPITLSAILFASLIARGPVFRSRPALFQESVGLRVVVKGKGGAQNFCHIGGISAHPE